VFISCLTRSSDVSFNPEGHRATNYTYWLESQADDRHDTRLVEPSSSGSGATPVRENLYWYPITYEGHYEPYIVAHRPTLPWFDERFDTYGFDKASHILQLAKYASLITHHSSLITHHSSLITHHASLITHHSSLITHHSSLITHHSSLITHHSSSISYLEEPLTNRCFIDRYNFQFRVLKKAFIVHLEHPTVWRIEQQFNTVGSRMYILRGA